VYGEEKVLDFTYLGDCVAGVQRVINQFNKASGTTFNIASGRGTSLVEVAQTIVDKVGSGTSITVESNRTGEVGRYVADISKANKILGYEPEFTVEDGIDATVNWYLDRPELFDNILE
jgi:UDP-glucose 4-epimerase